MIALVCLLGQMIIAQAPDLFKKLADYSQDLRHGNRGNTRGQPDTIPTISIQTPPEAIPTILIQDRPESISTITIQHQPEAIDIPTITIQRQANATPTVSVITIE
jgi:hypothetical protein